MSDAALEAANGVEIDVPGGLLEPQQDEALDEVIEDETVEYQPQDADSEELFCKICRLGSEEGNPLYYPCKCSGSIRYVHEPCLLEWIKHSKATKCELCKHVYKFTDVYGPTRDPLLVSTTRQVKMLIQSLPRNLVFLVRCMIVTFVWGVSLPILLAEIWNYIMGATPYPWFVEEGMKTWLPYQLNPLRLLLSACKGVFIFTGLFIGSGIMFLSMEQVEAFLEHVTFMRNHRRNRLQNQGRNGPQNQDQGRNEPQNQDQGRDEPQNQALPPLPDPDPLALPNPIPADHILPLVHDDHNNGLMEDEPTPINDFTPSTPLSSHSSQSGPHTNFSLLHSPHLSIQPNIHSSSWLEILKIANIGKSISRQHLALWSPLHRYNLTLILEDEALRANLSRLLNEEHQNNQLFNVHRLADLDILFLSHWQRHRETSVPVEITSDEVSLEKYFDAFMSECRASWHAAHPSPLDGADEEHLRLYAGVSGDIPSLGTEYEASETNKSVSHFRTVSGQSLSEVANLVVLSESILQLAFRQIDLSSETDLLTDDMIELIEFDSIQVAHHVQASSSDPKSSLKGVWSQMLARDPPSDEISRAITNSLLGSRDLNEVDQSAPNNGDMDGGVWNLFLLTCPRDNVLFWLEKLRSSFKNDEDEETDFSSLSDSNEMDDAPYEPFGDLDDTVIGINEIEGQNEQDEAPLEAINIREEDEVPLAVQAPPDPVNAPLDDETREEEVFLDGFADADDEDSEALQNHWLIAIFGRRDRDRDQNENQAGEAPQEDVPFTDMLGLSGNMLWIFVAMVMVLVFGTLEITFAILVPQLVGKFYVMAQSSLLTQFEPWWQSLVITVPNLSEIMFWFHASLGRLVSLSPSINDAIVSMYHSIVEHPLTQIAIQPTSVGYLVCAVVVLIFSSKRSPLAILIRSVIAHILEFVVIPAILGNMAIQFASTICRLEDDIYRVPYSNRSRMQKHVAKIVYGGIGARWALWELFSPSGNSGEISLSLESLSASPLDAGFGTVTHAINQTLSHIAHDVLHLNSSTPSVLDPLADIATSEQMLNGVNGVLSSIGDAMNQSAVNLTQAVVASANEASTARSTMLETAILHIVLQIESWISYFYIHYLELVFQLFIGYLVMIAWVNVLKTIRNSLKPGTITFLKFPGDGDFSFFLFLANNSMTHVMARLAVTLLFNAIGISILFGIPTTIIKWLIASGFSSLYRIALPTSAFQSFSDSNIAITFVPISILLIKPIKTTGNFVRFIVRILARLFDIEAQVLPDHVLRQIQQAQPNQAERVAAEIAPGAPNGGGNAEINPNDGDVPRNGVGAEVVEAGPIVPGIGLRKVGAAIIGMAMLSGAVLGCLTIPWIVGTWVYQLWMPESEAYPINSYALGAYFVVIAVRIVMVYVSIYRAHRATRAAILEDDEEARGVLARTTFDNVFRATVILLAILLIIPVILGYLVRVVLSNSILPANVMVTIHSPLNEYSYGLIFMRFLDGLTRWPNPWFTPVRQVLDTLSFDGIIQVDYTAFLNHLVYPLASFAFLLLGAPTIVNVFAYFYLPDMPDDQFVNFKRKSFILLPLALIWLVILYYWLSSAFRAIDHFWNGKIVVSRQIHNLETQVPVPVPPTQEEGMPNPPPAENPPQLLPPADPALIGAPNLLPLPLE